MAKETKRYDVGGLPAGGRRVYPDGTVLKLTEEQAKAMGATKVSKMKTTADSAEKVDSYEAAMTRQDEARSATAASKKRAAPAPK